MSKSATEPNAKPARPLNRWSLGSLSVLQTALLALIVIAANYLSFHHYLRTDLSRSADYSLSSATKHYLASPAVRDREKPIKWIMAFRHSLDKSPDESADESPFYDRIRALAEEYARLSNGKIQLSVVDPMRNPDRMQEVMAAYGLTLVRDMIIIDARTDESAATAEVDKTRILNPHIKLALAEDMGVFTTAKGTRKPTAFQGEELLTASLVESIEGHPRKMALIADKSGLDAKDGGSLSKALEDTLRCQNIELTELSLSGPEKNLDTVEGIVLAAPKYDLTDSELAALERYWKKPRSAILVLIDGGNTPPKLRAFLRGNGITPRKDRVIARETDKLVTAARGNFTSNIPFTKDLWGQGTWFGGASSSLDVRERAGDLENRQISPMGVILAANGFWGETRFGKGNEAFDEREDNKPPLHLAACATRGAKSDDPFTDDRSRMVVMSNTDFLDPRYQNAANLDFLASSANWLVGRDALAGNGPHPLGMYHLPLLDAQISFINRVNLFFLPAFFVLIGGFVWMSRRV